MGFVKVVKTKAYYKRFQVKYRRRREAKTDYYARTRLIIQDKNKYKTPKYRFVVRFTNRDVICQIASADLTHHDVIASAYSHELPLFGVKTGLTNYAAAYCTGLLLARRVNKKFSLEYEGNTVVDGEDMPIEVPDEGKKPFKALLDVGLRRTSTGARLFGALKGACDGGIDIPHSDRRFPGSKKEQGAAKHTASPETHRKYIFGGHVAAYMQKLQSEDEERYNKQFKAFIDNGINHAGLEKMYAAAHAAIRKDPHPKKDPLARGYFGKRATARKEPPAKKSWRKPKKALSQKKARVKQLLLAKGVVSVNDRGGL
jgi:large subunit ribosomal protein L5e